MNRTMKLLTNLALAQALFGLLRKVWSEVREVVPVDARHAQAARRRLARAATGYAAAAAAKGQAAAREEQAELAAAADEYAAAVAARLSAAQAIPGESARLLKAAAVATAAAAETVAESVAGKARTSAQVAAERLNAAAETAEQELQAWQRELAQAPQLKTAVHQARRAWAQHGWGEAKARRLARRRRADQLAALAVGAASGALLIYFLDSQAGPRRREQVIARLRTVASGLRERFGSEPGHRVTGNAPWGTLPSGLDPIAVTRPTRPAEEIVVSELRGDATGHAFVPVEIGTHHAIPDVPSVVAPAPEAPPPHPVPDTAAEAEATVEAAVGQLEAGLSAEPGAQGQPVAYAQSSVRSEPGATEVPLGQWQQMFDELLPQGETRPVVVEATSPIPAAVTGQPLLGASVNLRADGRDVRLIFGSNLGNHVEHLVADVRALEVLPARGGFRLQAADGITTVRFDSGQHTQ